MHSDNHVKHYGVVTEITFNSIVVRVDEPARCEGCAIAVTCSNKPGEGAETIVIPKPRNSIFAPGDRVSLEASSGSQLKASFWSFILPTAILVAVVLYLSVCHPTLGFWTILIAVGAVAVYDLILFTFRKDLAMSVKWQIRHC